MFTITVLLRTTALNQKKKTTTFNNSTRKSKIAKGAKNIFSSLFVPSSYHAL